ncbi:MAG: hypothetical protein ACKVK6_17780, partial [bacterium]
EAIRQAGEEAAAAAAAAVDVPPADEPADASDDNWQPAPLSARRAVNKRAQTKAKPVIDGFNDAIKSGVDIDDLLRRLVDGVEDPQSHEGIERGLLSALGAVRRMRLVATTPRKAARGEVRVRRLGRDMLGSGFLGVGGADMGPTDDEEGEEAEGRRDVAFEAS